MLVAEDHPVVREGLAALLEREGGFTLTGRAANGREVRAQIERQPPQVLVLDLMLQAEDGLALIKDLAAFAPALRIVVFSLHAEDVYAERCLRAGAHGYVMKREPVTTLFQAIREVAAGGIAVSPRVSAAVLGALAGHARQPIGSMAALTDRELQVFRLVGLALPTREIAEKLGVSVKTIETHRENLKNKLGLHSHAELVARAARWLREAEQG
ncbi:MAG: response regulator transcription factor [Opitutae bacterium]|nr:response regulator transcription factor [Opitutae bacterium]